MIFEEINSPFSQMKYFESSLFFLLLFDFLNKEKREIPLLFSEQIKLFVCQFSDSVNAQCKIRSADEF